MAVSSPTANVTGTTGTGLDFLVSSIAADPGLNERIARSQIAEGATAADGMNHMIVDAIRATGVANDGTLSTSDIYDVGAYIHSNWLGQWTVLHGDDENGIETGFHLVQGDGGQSRLFGLNLVDTVADGIFHMGFDIEWGRFLNEDGDSNAAVETVAFWLTELLADDLASGTLANPGVDPYARGTTGTGLDSLIDTIGQDAGLNNKIPTSQITAGLEAADGMNNLLVDAIRATGVANDGTLTTSDIYDVNAYIRTHCLAQWTALHGDDENGIETGFHLIQGDGSYTRAYGQSLVDTVADGIYHTGFAIQWGSFLNEDGNSNASVSTVAYWLSDVLADDLASGNLANSNVDAYSHGTTGTGLDAIIDMIAADPNLNNRIATSQITAGLDAADGMNALIVEAIRATGVADDGRISNVDVEDLNAYLRANHLAAWTALHGDDENGIETGFHLVQGDGGVTPYFGQNLTDTVADGIYHLGFEIRWDRFLNEDGNGNASVGQVAEWLNLFLKDDLTSGALSSGEPAVDPATLTNRIAYSLPDTLTVENRAGYREIGHLPSLELRNGTFALTFTANSPDDGDRNVLFSKDSSGNGSGEITAWISEGRLYVLLQNGSEEVKLSSGEIRIEAGSTHDMAFSFGRDGAQLYLDGEKVDTAAGFTANLLNNTDSLVIGAGTWGRTDSNPSWMWDHFDGTIEGFTIYDRALDRNEVSAISTSGPLADLSPGSPADDGALPAVYAGTGLTGKVFDRASNFSSIDDLDAYIESSRPTHTFDATIVDFGTSSWSSITLREFIGSSGRITSGDATTDMESIGIRLTGYVWIPEGDHLLTVRSDDGYRLTIGDQVFSSQTWGRGFEPTAKMATFGGGLYKIELIYFENSGDEALRLELDGRVMGAEHFYRSLADYRTALADHGAMPDGGLPPIDALPHGTTGTGLDQIVDIITSDFGLAARVSEDDLAQAARSADIMSNLIVEAIRETGVADDNDLTTSDMYDVSAYIRLHHENAWVIAHGDDENGVETGFHLVQSDGAVTRLFGKNAIDTVADGIFHTGFDIMWGRFLNEDGNANASVESVAFYLSELLHDDLLDGSLYSSARPVGDAAVVESSATHVQLGRGTIEITLKGQALDVTGNRYDNIIRGSAKDNTLDGSDGDDTIYGGAGNDMLIGGRGADHMVGGSGNDTYTIDNAGDTVEESASASGGTDTIIAFANLSGFRLVEGIENFQFAGRNAISVIGNAANNEITTSGASDVIDGRDGDDTLNGGAGRDLIKGGSGDDLIDGGEGADDMRGGAGNDTYYVDTRNDKVSESSNEGIDKVLSTTSYKLGANIEKLSLIGWNDIDGTGNALNNVICGNDGDNTLNGKAGADRMCGGGGDDLYIVDARDTIVELDGGGFDTVKSTVSHTLARNVEKLVLAGSDAINGTGSRDDNVIVGNDADNKITGGLGADRLTGQGGSDKFVFNNIADSRGNSFDTITDFSRSEGDRIDLRGVDANAATGADNAFFEEVAAGTDFSRWGQYRFTKIDGGYMAEFNTDADAAAEFVIKIMTPDTLTAGCFLL